MGFRFRKSFKLMPGVKINLSKGGISTTLGAPGASVNIGKKGAHLNTSFAGFSNRTPLTGGTSTRGRSVNTTLADIAPKTPQPASTRWFSFGVTLGLIGIIAGINTYVNPGPGKKVNFGDTAAIIAFWGIFATAWWLIRKAIRSNKQSKHETYIARQAANEAAERQELIERQEAAEREANARQVVSEQAAKERELQRLATFEPHLEKARQFYLEGLFTSSQLEEFEKEPLRPYSSASSLEYNISSAEKEARSNRERRETINSKYDEVTADKLIRRQPEPGMTREQLIDSMGNTEKVERTLTKTGERETLIYGSKSSGSYFHIVDGIIVKAVVR